MQVRGAEKEDLLDVRRVVEAALWEAYDGLLKPDTIEDLVGQRYSPGSLRRRLLEGALVVATAGEGRTVGFAIGVPGADSVCLDALVVDPAFRRLGVASALLEAARGAEARPVSLDVLLGNDPAERFCEAIGMVPGEMVHDMIGDEPVVARRWWSQGGGG
jgi:GNAT superfamily N-acetyltransferase